MIAVDDKNLWNREIVSHPSFLQSWQWGELQKKLGRRVLRLNISGLLASTIEQTLPFGQTYIYVPHGPIIRDTTAGSWSSFTKAIAKSEYLKKPIFLRIEPLNREFGGQPIQKILNEAGFRPAKPVQPKTTLIIDLAKDEKDILEGMEHDTRYSIRTAEKRGVTVEFLSGEDKEKKFEVFWKIFFDTNRRHGLKTYPKYYYEQVAGLEGECSSKIAIASAEGKEVAAAVFVYFGDRVFYLFAGSMGGYGKFNAPTYLLWQAIRQAKKEGYRHFDFWGVSSENKNWAKITAFKKSFGGEEVDSAGAWDYVFNKPGYLIYNLVKKLVG
ncbi:MAG: peptidoglycan bridge formation glycyltransferase FemA/FemB family protein [Patescibacteria group bacterium]